MNELQTYYNSKSVFLKREIIMTKKNQIYSVIFSAILLVGIVIPCICDAAISGKLTWSRISLSSIILSWLIFLPIMMMGKRGIAWSLTSISVFILPYLYILSALLNTRMVFSIGAIMAIIFDLYLWIVFAIIKYIGAKKLQTYGILFLSAIPFLLIINAALSKLIAEPFIDGWDVLAIILMLIASISFLAGGYAQKRSARFSEN